MKKIVLSVRDLKAAASFYSELLGTPGEMLSDGVCQFIYEDFHIICQTKLPVEDDGPAFVNGIGLITTARLESIHSAAQDMLCREVDEQPVADTQGLLSFSLTDPFGNKLRFVQAAGYAA